MFWRELLLTKGNTVWMLLLAEGHSIREPSGSKKKYKAIEPRPSIKKARTLPLLPATDGHRSAGSTKRISRPKPNSPSPLLALQAQTQVANSPIQESRSCKGYC